MYNEKHNTCKGFLNMKITQLSILLIMLFLIGCGQVTPQPEKIVLEQFTKSEVESTTAIAPEITPEPDQSIQEENKVVFSFAGDCILGTDKGQSYEGSWNWYAQEYDGSYFLEKVQPWFAYDDFTIVNLESVLTDQPLTERIKGDEVEYHFKGPTQNIQALSKGSVEIACTANNHINDYGTEGKTDTSNAIMAAGITEASRDIPIYCEKNGITFGIIAVAYWGANQETATLATLAEMEENSDFQIVVAHGGEERLRVPEDWRVASFHNLIDGGADAVIAHHAHVLQPMELYNDKPIVYGLGNFTFGGNRNPENRTAIFQLTVTQEENGSLEQSYEIIPCYVHTGESISNWQPGPITDETEKQYVLDFMNNERETPF